MPKFHTLALSSAYLEGLWERYRSDAAAVPEDWRAALEILDDYLPSGALQSGPAALTAHSLVRRFAHLAARLNPLDRPLPEPWERLRSEFERRLSQTNEDRQGRALAALLEAYAGPLAVETGHIDDVARVNWIEERRESMQAVDDESRSRALAAIVKAETFERFMGLRFAGKKRFGAEGGESLHALIQRVLDRAAARGVQEVVVGTMHRGRLGLMANLFGEPAQQLFARMQGYYPLERQGLPADVPYHLGYLGEYHAPGGVVRVRVLPNPSHLEAINAVVLGYARSRQENIGSMARVLPLILHTDASVVAQGVVCEALQLSELSGHRVGGALNVVVNNQLGFTTEPEEGRSSRYCTAPWKMLDSLIVHVNGDEVDAVLAATDLAFDYREAFCGESVIDLVCIRVNGHNELDEPRFTQPLYYQSASARASISSRYAQSLAANGIVRPEFPQRIAQDYWAELEAAFVVSKNAGTDRVSYAAAPAPKAPAPLTMVAELASRIPDDGRFNPKAVRLTALRGEEWRSGVSWATAEVLALGTALSMGWDVRLTGQDVDRGAFSQRHLSLVDTASGERRHVFEGAPSSWGKLSVHNTSLSEYAALAYEYGYSIAASGTLNVWEAQFGDFANGAQIVFDQFISSGEEKWDQRSGLIVLLPHGLEGQGPEHSSARIERMLHLAANDNLRIAHPSTPANYFHLLVSQIQASARRPLIIFTPKKLLRLKAAMSSPSHFESSGFQRIIVNPAIDRAWRLVLCSGKIYFDLLENLASSERRAITLVRIEQFYPFPEAEIVQALRSAEGADVVWVQEEPANYGAWCWLRPRLEAALALVGRPTGPLRVLSRRESASPAGSFHGDHEADQRLLVNEALAREFGEASRAGSSPRRAGAPSDNAIV